MSNVVEEIFKIKADTAELIKGLQQAKGTYAALTDEMQKQVIELAVLEQKEKTLLAARQKSTNPTMQIQITKQIDENIKKLGALKESVDRFTKAETLAKVETDALGKSVSNAFKVTQIDAAGKSVQKLQSTFNPLNNSVNQLSRELPAFAVSAQVGFLAISNNLPIFFDAIEGINKQNAELAKSGAKPVSVLKQLGGAIFSMGSILSVAVTLLTIYGGAIVKTISELFKQREAFELNTESLKILNDEIEASERNYDEFTKRIIANSLEIIKISAGLSDLQFKNLTLLSKAQDEYDAIEKRRKKAIAEGVQAELNAGKERVKFTQTVANGIISIKNEETGEVIRLDKEMKDVIGRTVFGDESLTRTEKALQDKLDVINKKNQQEINQLTILLNEESKLATLAEKDKARIREKFTAEDLIRRKSAADEIRQLAIDANTDERGREEEQVRFNTEKAIRAIDEANMLEKEKKRIALSNYQNAVETAKANSKNEEQLNIDLLNLKRKYVQDVKKIESENISVEEQNELRIALELKLQKELAAIDEKYSKEVNERIRTDFERTIQARIDILNENKDFELFLLQDKYDQEKKKGKKASDEELKRLQELMLAKKIEILKDKAQQSIDDLINKERKDGAEVNATEILAIENKLQNDIERLKKKGVEVDKKSFKDRLKEYIDYFADIFRAAVDATNKILALKIKEVDGQISQQERRVEAAKNIADRGNAELLEMEQKRLDDLTKKKEKFVRDQQALAAVELVANTAIAVSKAAAQGGVAAGVTIAAALIALVAGLASARAIASQAAFYDGGFYNGDGFTGHGNPKEESKAVGSKPYTYHKEEMIFNHKKTRKFRDVFEGVHQGKIDLNEWKMKAGAYDQMVNYKPMTMRGALYANPKVVNIIQFKQMETKFDEMNQTLRALKLGLNIDENGFTNWQQKIIERKKHISNSAKL